MGAKSHQQTRSALWRLATGQHGVVARRQLLDLGFSSKAIEHRLAHGRLHRVRRGVYAVGRPALTRDGRWMAAVLRGGDDALLCHRNAGAGWGLIPDQGLLEITVPRSSAIRPPGIIVHRRDLGAEERRTLRSIPITSPLCTLVDLAACLDRPGLEAAINNADKLGLVSAARLPNLLDAVPQRPGLGAIRALIGEHEFRGTDSDLERRFLALVRAEQLPVPETGKVVAGYKTDFYWPRLGLVVETDGLRYHRTASAQARDRRRDQAHTANGLTTLRFTNAQIRNEADHVRSTLRKVVERLASAKARAPGPVGHSGGLPAKGRDNP